LAWSGTGSRDELGSLDILDVTTGALDREAPEVATGFLDSVEGVDRFNEPEAGACLLGADGNADTNHIQVVLPVSIALWIRERPIFM